MTNIVYLTVNITNNITNYNISARESLISPFFDPAIIGLVFGVLSFIITSYLSERKRRKSQSLVGAVIMESFIEEVKDGIAIMEYKRNNLSTKSLPNESWIGLKNKFDELIERTICVLKIEEGDEGEVYHLKKFRIHIKNYFTDICGKYNEHNGKEFSDLERYIEGSRRTLIMLESIRDLLQKNSKRLFPK